MSTGKDVFLALEDEIDPERNVIATYYVESPLGVKEAGRQIAIEQSIGTWTKVATTTEWITKTLAAKVFKWKGETKGIVSVAFPIELFDLESGIPNLLSIVAGNLFGLSKLRNARLLDIHLPRAFLSVFK